MAPRRPVSLTAPIQEGVGVSPQSPLTIKQSTPFDQPEPEQARPLSPLTIKQSTPFDDPDAPLTIKSSAPFGEPEKPKPPKNVFDLFKEIFDPRVKMPGGIGLEGVAYRTPFAGPILEAAKYADIYRAAQRVDSGEGTPRDEAILEAFVEEAQDDARGGTFAYNVGEIATMLPAFAIEFMATGGIFTASKKASLKGAQALLKRVSKKIADKKAAQVATKAVGYTAGSVAQATVGLPQRTLATGARLAAPTAEQIENGLKDWDDDFSTAMVKGWGDTAIEVFSERMGGRIFKAIGNSEVAKRWGAATVRNRVLAMKTALMERWLRGGTNRTVSQFLDKIRTEAAWGGILGEVYEERVGEAMRAALPVGRGDEELPSMIRAAMLEPGALEEFAVQMLTEASAFTLMPAARAAIERVATSKANRDEAKAADKFVGRVREAEAETAKAAWESKVDEALGGRPGEEAAAPEDVTDVMRRPSGPERADLASLGYTDEDVDMMRPEDARRIISEGVHSEADEPPAEVEETAPAPEVRDRRSDANVTAANAEPGDLFGVAVADLNTDPILQYKTGGDAEGAIEAERIEGDWEPESAGIVLIWRNPTDNKVYVVNGHQRFRAAKDKGVSRLNALMIEAESPEEARAKGAATNLRENMGTALDAARVIREFGQEKLRVSPRKAVARDGLALAQLSDPMFEKVESGELDQNIGAAIGAAGLAPEDQSAVGKLVAAQAKKGRVISPSVVSRLISRVQGSERMARPDAAQGSFDDILAEDQTIVLEEAELEDWLIREVKKNRTAAGYVGKAAKQGRLTGIAEVDIAAAKDAASRGAVAQKRLQTLVDQKGMVRDAVKRAAQRKAAGEDLEAIQAELLKAALEGVRLNLEGKDQGLATPEAERRSSRPSGAAGGPVAPAGGAKAEKPVAKKAKPKPAAKKAVPSVDDLVEGAMGLLDEAPTKEAEVEAAEQKMAVEAARRSREAPPVNVGGRLPDVPEVTPDSLTELAEVDDEVLPTVPWEMTEREFDQAVRHQGKYVAALKPQRHAVGKGWTLREAIKTQSAADIAWAYNEGVNGYEELLKDAAREGLTIPARVLDELDLDQLEDVEFAIEQGEKSKAKPLWEMTQAEFGEAAGRGQMHKHLGRDIPGEAEARTSLKLGELNDYSYDDIAHFYAFRRKPLRAAYEEFLLDAAVEGKPVGKALKAAGLTEEDVTARDEQLGQPDPQAREQLRQLAAEQREQRKTPPVPTAEDATRRELRLKALHRRATKYEVVLTRGDETLLVGYTGRKSFDGLFDRTRASGEDIIAAAGLTEEAEAKRVKGQLHFSNGWVVKFSGRTERQAIIEGEPPPVPSTEALEAEPTALEPEAFDRPPLRDAPEFDSSRLPYGPNLRRFQWQPNAQGGQVSGNQMTVEELTPELYAEYVAPRSDLYKTLEASQAALGDQAPTHLQLSRIQGKGDWRVTKVGSLDEVLPEPQSLQWVREVSSFTSPEALEWAQTPDQPIADTDPTPARRPRRNAIDSDMLEDALSPGAQAGLAAMFKQRNASRGLRHIREAMEVYDRLHTEVGTPEALAEAQVLRDAVDAYFSAEPTVESAAAVTEATFTGLQRITEQRDPDDAELLENQIFADAREAGELVFQTLDPQTAEFDIEEFNTAYGMVEFRRPKDQVFPPPDQKVDPVTKRDPFITQKEAKGLLAEWKAEAKQIGKTEDNSNKVVLSLFDVTGVWSQPWVDVGYEVRRFDIKNGQDLTRFGDWMGVVEEYISEGYEIFGILGAPPCTSFAVSGARWWKSQHDIPDNSMVEKKYGLWAAKHFDRPLDYANTLVAIMKLVVEQANPTGFYAMENPIGRIAQQNQLPRPTMVFDPHYFGDPHTKRTQIWGEFDTGLPTANVEPTKGSLAHKLRGDVEEQKAQRSETPEGFAYAFFMANHGTTTATLPEEPGPTQMPAEEAGARAEEPRPEPRGYTPAVRMRPDPKGLLPDEDVIIGGPSSTAAAYDHRLGRFLRNTWSKVVAANGETEAKNGPVSVDVIRKGAHKVLVVSAGPVKYEIQQLPDYAFAALPVNAASEKSPLKTVLRVRLDEWTTIEMGSLSSLTHDQLVKRAAYSEELGSVDELSKETKGELIRRIAEPRAKRRPVPEGPLTREEVEKAPLFGVVEEVETPEARAARKEASGEAARAASDELFESKEEEERLDQEQLDILKVEAEKFFTADEILDIEKKLNHTYPTVSYRLSKWQDIVDSKGKVWRDDQAQLERIRELGRRSPLPGGLDFTGREAPDELEFGWSLQEQVVSRYADMRERDGKIANLVIAVKALETPTTTKERKKFDKLHDELYELRSRQRSELDYLERSGVTEEERNILAESLVEHPDTTVSQQRPMPTDPAARNSMFSGRWEESGEERVARERADLKELQAELKQTTPKLSKKRREGVERAIEHIERDLVQFEAWSRLVEILPASDKLTVDDLMALSHRERSNIHAAINADANLRNWQRPLPYVELEDRLRDAEALVMEQEDAELVTVEVDRARLKTPIGKGKKGDIAAATIHQDVDSKDKRYRADSLVLFNGKPHVADKGYVQYHYLHDPELVRVVPRDEWTGPVYTYDEKVEQWNRYEGERVWDADFIDEEVVTEGPEAPRGSRTGVEVLVKRKVYVMTDDVTRVVGVDDEVRQQRADEAAAIEARREAIQAAPNEALTYISDLRVKSQRDFAEQHLEWLLGDQAEESYQGARVSREKESQIRRRLERFVPLREPIEYTDPLDDVLEQADHAADQWRQAFTETSNEEGTIRWDGSLPGLGRLQLETTIRGNVVDVSVTKSERPLTESDRQQIQRLAAKIETGTQRTVRVRRPSDTDVLSTGETQARLPGDVGEVRDQEVPDTPLAARVYASYTTESLRAAFNLSPQQAQAVNALLTAAAVDTSQVRFALGTGATVPVTESEAFKAWNGTKNVLTNPDGTPTMLFHGTSDDFTVFDFEHPNRKDAGWLGREGIYLTTSSDLASSYSLLKKKPGGRPMVKAFYARLENPFYATQADKERVRAFQHQDEAAAKAVAKQYSDELKAKGYDGVILKDKRSTEVVVFQKSAVKSVHNIGTWGRDTDDTLMQRAAQQSLVFQRLGALHNLTEDKLQNADRMGGFAMPSIAVMPEGMSVSSFGDITLIGRRDLGDPAKVTIFDSDAYTKRWPQPRYRKVSHETRRAFLDEWRPFATLFEELGELAEVEQNIFQFPRVESATYKFSQLESARAWYLKSEHGVTVAPVLRRRERHFPLTTTKAWRDFADNADWSQINSVEFRREAGEAVIQAKIEEREREGGEWQYVQARPKGLMSEDGVMYLTMLEALRKDDQLEGTMEYDALMSAREVEQAMKPFASEYKAWVHRTMGKVVGEPYLMSRGKRVPYTLRNIVEVMRRGGGRATEEVFTYGEGVARASAARRFRTMDEMRGAAIGRIDESAEISPLRQQLQDDFAKWRHSLLRYSPETPTPTRPIGTFESHDAAMRAIGRVARKANPTELDMMRELHREGFRETPRELTEEQAAQEAEDGPQPPTFLDLAARGVDLAKRLMDIPVPYFEAKPERAVALSEFAGAVIHRDTSEESRAILRRHGIAYREYEGPGTENRADAVREFQRELEEQGEPVLFQGSKGIVQFASDGTAIMHGFASADVSTALHEFAHVMRRQLFDRSVPPDLRAGISESDIRIAEAWSGAVNGDWTRLGPDGRMAEERFARGFERYIYDGKAPTAELRGVFAKLRGWLLKIYQILSGSPIDIDISPEMRRVFDKLVTRQASIDALKAMQTKRTVPARKARPGRLDFDGTDDLLFQEDERAAQREAVLDKFRTWKREREAWVQSVVDVYRRDGIATTMSTRTPGLVHSLSESTQEPGTIQVTSFSDGVPIGHYNEKTIEDAARSVFGEELVEETLFQEDPTKERLRAMMTFLSNLMADKALSFEDAVEAFQSEYGEGARHYDKVFEYAWKEIRNESRLVADVVGTLGAPELRPAPGATESERPDRRVERDVASRTAETEEDEETLKPFRESTIGVFSERKIEGAPGELDLSRPVEMPEMLALVQELLGAQLDDPNPNLKVEIVKKFRRDQKVAETRFGPEAGYRIRLLADLFKEGNERQIAAVLAKQLGSVIDALPHNMLSRGNLLGRLQSLHKYMRHTFTTPDGREIKNAEVSDELKALSKEWHPWDEATATDKYKALRNSSRQLYSDAISALFNSPGWVAQQAPIFYREFHEGLDSKPEVKEAFFALQDLLEQDRSELLRRNRMRVREGFAYGEMKALDIQRMKRGLRLSKWKDVVLDFEIHFINKHYKMIKLVDDAIKAGADIPPDANITYALAQFPYVTGMLKEIGQTHLVPMYQDVKERAEWAAFNEAVMYERIIDGDRSQLANPYGISPARAQELYDHLSQDMGPEKMAAIAENIARFRKFVAQIIERGWAKGLYTEEQYESFKANPAYATWRSLEHIENEINAHIYKQLGTVKGIAMPVDATIHKMLATVVAAERNEMVRLGVDFLKEFYPHEIEDAQVVRTARGSRPVPSQEKDKFLVRYLDQGKLKGVYVDRYIAMSLNRETIDANGKIIQALRIVNSGFFRPVFVGVNVGFQSYNLARDFLRYWRNMGAEHPETTLADALYQYFQTLPMAKVRSFGLSEKGSPFLKALGFSRERELQGLRDLRESEKVGVLGISFNDYMQGRQVEDSEIEEILAQLGHTVWQHPERSPQLLYIPQVLEFLRNLGDFIETLPKGAAIYQLTGSEWKELSEEKREERQLQLRGNYLAKRQISDLDAAERHFVRSGVGTPDLWAGGYYKPITNEVFLFSNAMTQGTNSDLRFATMPKTRSGWWWRIAAVNIVPKLVQYLIAIGAADLAVRALTGGGDDEDRNVLDPTEGYIWDALAGRHVSGSDQPLADLYRKVSEYDKANYIIVVLGWDLDGNAVYVRLPQDEIGRMVGALTWKALTGATEAWGEDTGWEDQALQIGSMLQSIMDYTAGQLPSISPGPQVLGDALQVVAFGQNPYDPFRGRRIFTEAEWRAKDWGTVKKFIGYEFQQIGGSIVWKFVPGDDRPEREKTLARKIVEFPVISNLAGRFIRYMNYGETEEDQKVSDRVRRDKSRLDRKVNRDVNEATEALMNQPTQSIGELRRRARTIRNTYYGNEPREVQEAQLNRIQEKISAGLVEGRNDSLLNSVVYAETNAEKLALIVERTDRWTQARRVAWINEARGMGAISDEVAREARFRVRGGRR